MDNSDFFDINELLQDDYVDFFTTTDVDSIFGKNLVLNFLSKIDLELKMFGYSDVALEVADYYSQIKLQKGISAFYENPVIKMILEEIQYMPTVRNFLNKRIFNLIKQEYIAEMNKTFKENEILTKKVKSLEKQKDKKVKILKSKKEKPINDIDVEEYLNIFLSTPIKKEEKEKK